eukprot:CAMPEP_0181338044 /NCGR_PEP_ID=MMETSP1101-20121128/28409_1 /TAXON_ID=46948 /ORGANISM="Rhodomonas abbreviata, Strain Caron Lab Isolate" /LENGTH=485 /DNA_ID=CAMNT_0023448713 /DNA_START=428 /DNA_END=1885 /DNA_ORIENTATION=-
MCSGCKQPFSTGRDVRQDPVTLQYSHISCFVKPAGAAKVVRNVTHTYELLNSTDLASLVKLVQAKWDASQTILVIDPSGDVRVTLGNHGTVTVSFKTRDEIVQVLSHRWGATVTVNGKDFPTEFLSKQYDCLTWVDALSHLNDPALVQQTLSVMGEIYATKPCRALYFEETLQNAWDAIVRGWMWQELVPGPQMHRYSDGAIRALHILYRSKTLAGVLLKYGLSRDPRDSIRPYGGPYAEHARCLEKLSLAGCSRDQAVFVNELFIEVGMAGLQSLSRMFQSLCVYDDKFTFNDSALLHSQDYGHFGAWQGEPEPEVQFTLKEVLQAALPVLVRWDRPKSNDDLIIEAISHLSCKNYCKPEDCMVASFSVVLWKLGKNTSPEVVHRLLADNFDRFMEHHTTFALPGPYPGLTDPLGVLNGRTNVVLKRPANPDSAASVSVVTEFEQCNFPGFHINVQEQVGASEDVILASPVLGILYVHFELRIA